MGAAFDSIMRGLGEISFLRRADDVPDPSVYTYTYAATTYTSHRKPINNKKRGLRILQKKRKVRI